MSGSASMTVQIGPDQWAGPFSVNVSIEALPLSRILVLLQSWCPLGLAETVASGRWSSGRVIVGAPARRFRSPLGQGEDRSSPASGVLFAHYGVLLSLSPPEASPLRTLLSLSLSPFNPSQFQSHLVTSYLFIYFSWFTGQCSAAGCRSRRAGSRCPSNAPRSPLRCVSPVM